MLKNFFRLIVHTSLILLLTVLTQIGGLVYLLTLIIVRRNRSHSRSKRMAVFLFLYGMATFLVVPPLASYMGRERIKESQIVIAHSFFYKLANRNYVTPELNSVLESTSLDFQRKYPGIKLVHLDANFPFIDGFPLLPHLSHNDGKKIDVTLIYKEESNVATNLKPSVSGYGVYEGPKTREFDQISKCKVQGYWQYDFPKYLTLGTINNTIRFSEEGTRLLTLSFLKQKEVSKLFIEPHLKSRLRLTNNKVRFHGCGAVRHDDHIHIQVK